MAIIVYTTYFEPDNAFYYNFSLVHAFEIFWYSYYNIQPWTVNSLQGCIFFFLQFHQKADYGRNYLVPALSLLNRDIIAALAYKTEVCMYVILKGDLDPLQKTLRLVPIDCCKRKQGLLPVWHQHIQCESPHSQTSPGDRNIYLACFSRGYWGCGSNISPLSTSQKYWLLPSHREGTTYGSRRTDFQTAQET